MTKAKYQRNAWTAESNLSRESVCCLTFEKLSLYVMQAELRHLQLISGVEHESCNVISTVHAGIAAQHMMHAGC